MSTTTHKQHLGRIPTVLIWHLCANAWHACRHSVYARSEQRQSTDWETWRPFMWGAAQLSLFFFWKTKVWLIELAFFYFLFFCFPHVGMLSSRYQQTIGEKWRFERLWQKSWGNVPVMQMLFLKINRPMPFTVCIVLVPKWGIRSVSIGVKRATTASITHLLNVKVSSWECWWNPFVTQPKRGRMYFSKANLTATVQHLSE